ncbi:AtzE family amidohydrolase [Acuticoccus mangrovi]|uniref:AtzE family amidohydrolase n=1 Tax=Acuticoccus mangrovi TaxID=2796142 RepID=A0A934IU87_9HYPH|nr:AtzE family amidohydrolase [Acuticoccus mangrovi]MBJ3778140.1 AtzE family amidohydrolase [Acuticoccus mangrovi]
MAASTTATALLDKGVRAIAAAVRTGTVSRRAVVEAALERIAALNGPLNAFTDILAERALAKADAGDRASAPDAPLAGVPFAVKNLYDVAGIVTRAGSLINRDDPPASSDAFLVRRLEAAGAILVGALNMGEYAYDFTGENAHDGHSLNPLDPTRMSGGSSGGSGTAVGSGMVPAALGTDTNGSIRVPASFCGIWGLKPTFGRLSRSGTFAFVPALDHTGPMARSAGDLAALYDAMTGEDPEDTHQTPHPAPATLPGLDEAPDGLRIAVAGGWFKRGLTPEAQRALALAAEALEATREVELPGTAAARAAAYVLTNLEAAGMHFTRLQRRAADYDPETRDRFLAGVASPAVWLTNAQRVRATYRAAVAKVFEEIDVLIAPATPFPALRSGQQEIEIDGRTLTARPNIGLLTQPISFAGLPVTVAPMRLSGLPVGLQIITRPWDEATGLRVGRHLEKAGLTLSSGI